mmetsp:Transcript_6/g.8  ORF Transcript_6/g.8 Transcript_6/m.8 type:complete len:167 (-) Transcript_6:13-513(-)
MKSNTMATTEKQIWKVKSYYFLFFLSYAAIIPYLNLQFRQAGLSAAEIGLVAACRPWVAAFASYAGPSVADRLSAHRVCFIGAFAVSVLARAVVALPVLHSGLFDPFWAIYASMVVSDAMFSICLVLADAAVISSLGDPLKYGQIRMWGSAGWGVMALGGGWVIAR